MTQLKLLLTGATGYVGGNVLAQLVTSAYPKITDLSITAIVRKQEQADALSAHGVQTRLFNGLDDTAQLREIAAEFDIVIHCAMGFHTPSAEALVLGLGDAQKRTGEQKYFIQTTGTSNLAVSAVSHPNATVKDICDTDDVFGEETVRESQEKYPQRTTDLVVVKTAERTGVKAYLMMPPTIYGKGKGFFNQQSMQVPHTIEHAIKEGRAEYIGDGSGTIGYVHAADLAALYELLVLKILEGADLPSGRKGIYFSNTGSFNWKELNGEIGEIGVRLGVLKSPTAVSISLEEAHRKWGFGGDVQALEMNHAAKSLTTPKLAFDLFGWEPTKTEQDWHSEIEETFKAVLRAQRG